MRLTPDHNGKVKCHYCPEMLDPDSRYTWHRTMGWARRGSAGGSDVVLRKRIGDFVACDVCISRLRAGRSPDQETLI
jgi:hypothetical protein